LKTEKTILVFRHGHTRYWQGNDPYPIENAWDLATAPKDDEEESCDLIVRVREAVDDVAQYARTALEHFDYCNEFRILSSPTGRCIHTAIVIAKTMIRSGFNCKGIDSLEELTEIKNFQWQLFFPLCVGGEVEHQEEKFRIDNKMSNPESLPFGEYFMTDTLHKLAPSVTSAWPKSYVDKIKSFERSADVRTRMLGVLCRVAREENSQTVLVTHDALTGFMVKAFTDGAQNELPNGSFLVLKGDCEKLEVFAVGENREGDSDTNIFDL